MVNDKKAISISNEYMYFIDKEISTATSYETINNSKLQYVNSTSKCNVNKNIKTHIENGSCNVVVSKKNINPLIVKSNTDVAHTIKNKNNILASTIVYKNNLLRIKEKNICSATSSSISYNSDLKCSVAKSISYPNNTNSIYKVIDNTKVDVVKPIKSYNKTGNDTVYVSKKNYNKFNIISNQGQTFVEPYKPPSFDGLISAQGLKNAKIVLQKESFVDLKLNFSDTKVVGATGLPTGLCFENGRIKGSPIQSSTYPVELMMDNNTKLSIIIVVPNVERIL